MYNDTQMNVIKEFQNKNKQLVTEFHNFVLETEFNDKHSVCLEEKVDWLNKRNEKEVNIYKEKIERLDEKIQRMRMPIEDMQSQMLRMEERNQKLIAQNEKLEAQLKYVGQRYTAALIARLLNSRRQGKIHHEREMLELEKRKLKAYQQQNAASISLMNQIKNKLEEKYKGREKEKRSMSMEE